jgi:hypothetical protein
VILLPHLVDRLNTHSITQSVLSKEPNERASLEIVTEDGNQKGTFFCFSHRPTIDRDKVETQVQVHGLLLGIDYLIEVPHFRHVIKRGSMDDTQEIVEEQRDLIVCKAITVEVLDTVP